MQRAARAARCIPFHLSATRIGSDDDPFLLDLDA
jgi:hypothetical protein